MLETASHALARGAKPLLCLGPQAEAEEVEHFYSSNNSSAIALGRVLQNVIKQRPALSEIRTIVSDFNGESYYAHEWGLTKTRLGPLCQHSISLIHPADCYGDVGAATGGLLIALAAYQFAKQSNNCPPAILTTANDSGMRCALVVEPYQNIK
jgi:3-oxoacyl-[acyl-carrier-protein] synthase-1